jgi:hypothetical protein
MIREPNIQNFVSFHGKRKKIDAAYLNKNPRYAIASDNSALC